MKSPRPRSFAHRISSVSGTSATELLISESPQTPAPANAGTNKDVLSRQFRSYRVYLCAVKVEDVALRLEERSLPLVASEQLGMVVSGLELLKKAIFLRVNFALLNEGQLPNGAYLNNVSAAEARVHEEGLERVRDTFPLPSRRGSFAGEAVYFPGGVCGANSGIDAVRCAAAIEQTKSRAVMPRLFIAAQADSAAEDLGPGRRYSRRHGSVRARSPQPGISADARIITTSNGAMVLGVNGCVWEQAENVIMRCNTVALCALDILGPGYLTIISDALAIAEILLWVPGLLRAPPRTQIVGTHQTPIQAELQAATVARGKEIAQKCAANDTAVLDCSALAYTLLPSRPGMLSRGPVMGFDPFYGFQALRRLLLGFTLSNFGVLQRAHHEPAERLVVTFEWALRVQACRGSCLVLFNLAAALVEARDFYYAVDMALLCIRLGDYYMKCPFLSPEADSPAFDIFIRHVGTTTVLARHLLVTLATWSEQYDIALWQAQEALACARAHLGTGHALTTRCADRLETVREQSRGFITAFSIVSGNKASPVSPKALKSESDVLRVFDKLREAAYSRCKQMQQRGEQRSADLVEWDGSTDDTPPLLPLLPLRFEESAFLPSAQVQFLYAFPLPNEIQRFADGIAGMSTVQKNIADEVFPASENRVRKSKGSNRINMRRALSSIRSPRSRNIGPRKSGVKGSHAALNQKAQVEATRLALLEEKARAELAASELDVLSEVPAARYIPLPETLTLFKKMPFNSLVEDGILPPLTSRSHRVTRRTSKAGHQLSDKSVPQADFSSPLLPAVTPALNKTPIETNLFSRTAEEGPPGTVRAFDGHLLLPQQLSQLGSGESLSRHSSVRLYSPSTMLCPHPPTLSSVDMQTHPSALDEVTSTTFDGVERSAIAVSVMPLRDYDLYFALQRRVHKGLEERENMLLHMQRRKLAESEQVKEALRETATTPSGERAAELSPARFCSVIDGVMPPQAVKIIHESDYELRQMSAVIPDHTWEDESRWETAARKLNGFFKIIMAKRERRRRIEAVIKALHMMRAQEIIARNCYNYIACKPARNYLEVLRVARLRNSMAVVAQEFARMKLALAESVERALQQRLTEALIRRGKRIRNISALLIQTLYRGYRVRLKIIAWQEAVKKLQRIWRLYSAFKMVRLLVFAQRVRVRELHEKRCAAATRIQRWYRHLLLAKRAREELFRRKEALAAYLVQLQIQDDILTSIVGKYDEDEVLKAAQRIGRAFIVRLRLFAARNQYKVEVAAVAVIVCAMRAYATRCRVSCARLAHDTDEVARRHLEERIVAAIDIQKTVRRFLERVHYEALQRELIARNIAAERIQAAVRAFLTRQWWRESLRGEQAWEAGLYLRAQHRTFAATRIQSVYRGFAARKFVKLYKPFVKEQEPYYANILQRAVRCFLAHRRTKTVKEARTRLFDLIAAAERINRDAVRIQAFWRMCLALHDPVTGRHSHPTFIKLKAIVRIQHQWRMHAQRCRFKQLVLARAHRDHQLRVAESLNTYATVIQATFRRYRSRFSLQNRLQRRDVSAILLIQRFCRRCTEMKKRSHAAMKAARSFWQELQAGSDMRSAATLTLKTHEDEKRLMCEVRSATSILRWYRLAAARKKLKQLKAERERTLLETVENERNRAAIVIQHFWEKYHIPYEEEL